MIDYNSKTVAELRVIAKEFGIIGYSKMRKSDLINQITIVTNVEFAEPNGRNITADISDDIPHHDPILEDTIRGFEEVDEKIEDWVEILRKTLDRKTSLPKVEGDSSFEYSGINDENLIKTLRMSNKSHILVEKDEGLKEVIGEIFSSASIPDDMVDLFHKEVKEIIKENEEFMITDTMNRKQHRKMLKIQQLRMTNPNRNFRKMING